MVPRFEKKKLTDMYNYWAPVFVFKVLLKLIIHSYYNIYLSIFIIYLNTDLVPHFYLIGWTIANLEKIQFTKK